MKPEVTYFDAVIGSGLEPIFNGTPDETREWLADAIERGVHSDNWRVCIGVSLSLVTVDEYLRRGN